MKRSINLYVFILLLGLLGSSCTATRETEVEDELGEFRTWVSQQTSQLANATEEDWKQAKQDFRMRTQELDQIQDSFTDEVKEEYKQLKQEFTDADQSFQAQLSQTQVSEWERKLLGDWADMSTINETNVRDAYIAFMENVRTLKSDWTNEDWEMAKLVLDKLDNRKNEITGDIDTDSVVKIKALQMEFRTLETAADL